jgi:hypothetical protein
MLLSSISVLMANLVMEEIFSLTTARLYFQLLMETADWNLMEEMIKILIPQRKSKYMAFQVDVSNTT